MFHQLLLMKTSTSHSYGMICKASLQKKNPVNIGGRD